MIIITKSLKDKKKLLYLNIILTAAKCLSFTTSRLVKEKLLKHTYDIKIIQLHIFIWYKGMHILFVISSVVVTFVFQFEEQGEFMICPGHTGS